MIAAKAILFDLDGTLTDPREGITRSIAYALERMGLEPPPLDHLTFAIGPPLRPTLAKLIGDETPATVERALALYRERFADVGLFENAVYDGIAEVLRTLTGRGIAVAFDLSEAALDRTPRTLGEEELLDRLRKDFAAEEIEAD